MPTLSPDHEVEALVQAAVEGLGVPLLICFCDARGRLPTPATRGVISLAPVVVRPELWQVPVVPPLDLFLPLVVLQLPFRGKWHDHLFNTALVKSGAHKRGRLV